jgi:hypothetical protein
LKLLYILFLCHVTVWKAKTEPITTLARA